MPLWAVITIVAGVFTLLAGGIALAVMGWRAYERRLLLKLVVRTEGVEAAAAALTDAVSRLAAATDVEIGDFAADSESVERRIFAEVRTRSGILTDELDRMPMPAKLIPAAEAIADAACVVGEQAALVGDKDVGSLALDRLGNIDLARMRAYLLKARMLLARACDVCGLQDTAVYGGGLYL
jgi:hypothetical protein